jgi:hypothetical protein
MCSFPFVRPAQSRLHFARRNGSYSMHHSYHVVSEWEAGVPSNKMQYLDYDPFGLGRGHAVRAPLGDAPRDRLDDGCLGTFGAALLLLAGVRKLFFPKSKEA